MDRKGIKVGQIWVWFDTPNHEFLIQEIKNDHIKWWDLTGNKLVNVDYSIETLLSSYKSGYTKMKNKLQIPKTIKKFELL